MILDVCAELYNWEEKSVSNTGQILKRWIKTRDININFQPAGLSQAELSAHGIDTRASDVRRVFSEVNTDCVINSRLYVEGEGIDGWFEIRTRNKWPVHCEYLAVPLQGS